MRLRARHHLLLEFLVSELHAMYCPVGSRSKYRSKSEIRQNQLLLSPMLDLNFVWRLFCWLDRFQIGYFDVLSFRFFCFLLLLIRLWLLYLGVAFFSDWSSNCLRWVQSVLVGTLMRFIWVLNHCKCRNLFKRVARKLTEVLIWLFAFFVFIGMI